MVLPLFLGPQTKVTGGEESVEATVFAASDHSCVIIMFIIGDVSSTELPIANGKYLYVSVCMYGDKIKGIGVNCTGVFTLILRVW